MSQRAERIGTPTDGGEASGGLSLRPRDLRLVPVVAGVWVAAGVVTTVVDLALPVTIIAWVLVLVGVVLAARRGLAVPVLIAAAIAVASMHVTLQAPLRAAVAELPARVSGPFTVLSKLTPAWEGAWRLSGTVTTDGLAIPAEVLFSGERPAGADLGAVLWVTGRVESAGPGDRALVALRSSRPPDVIAAPNGALAVAAQLRQGLLERAGRFPGDGAQLIPGMAVGDTSGVDVDLDQAMKTSSLAHLLAVSGSNCLLVVGAGFALAAACGLPRAARVLMAVGALAAFVILVTPEPSVVRAAAMSTVSMLAVLLGRAKIGLHVLSVAVIVLLCSDPWLASEVGFALSVAATAALLVLGPPAARTVAGFLPMWMALPLAAPIVAQLACAPILVLISPAVSLSGVLANVLAAPAAPVATLAGMLGCFFAAVPVLGDALISIAWVPAQWVGSTARLTASLPQSVLPWQEGLLGAVTLGVVCAALAVLLVRARSPMVRRGAAAVALASIGIGVGAWLVRSTVVPLLTPSTWSVAMCDVGQGDATVLRSAGIVALVDTGPDPALLDGCLQRLGIARVDLLLLTHFDLDHVGGAAAVIGRVGVLLHGPTDGDADAALVDRLHAQGARVVDARRGLSGDLGDARWRVLWPTSGRVTGNPASVVLEVTGDGFPATLLLGDLDAEAQRGLLRAGGLRSTYDIVKVSHHGSADQEPRLYAALHPRLALIGVGRGNDYGHPRDDTLNMLAALGTVIARTDDEGLLLAQLTGEDLRVWREHAPP
ncbi:ComEC/Rec2 family competence protein [Microbacterium sp. ZW T5_56]|uniref:ComEC/Rec2 family competence protein n=1 Tax=Microbacterium sp. ZW T5_56 TaxID=3378081 RepID=UPI0038524C8C